MMTLLIIGTILAGASVGAIMGMLLVTLRTLDDIADEVQEMKKKIDNG